MTHSITSKYNYDVVIKYSEEVNTRMAQAWAWKPVNGQCTLHLLFFCLFWISSTCALSSSKTKRFWVISFFSYQAFPWAWVVVIVVEEENSTGLANDDGVGQSWRNSMMKRNELNQSKTVKYNILSSFVLSLILFGSRHSSVHHET